jgi:hypothetical protein
LYPFKTRRALAAVCYRAYTLKPNAVAVVPAGHTLAVALPVYGSHASDHRTLAHSSSASSPP